MASILTRALRKFTSWQCTLSARLDASVLPPGLLTNPFEDFAREFVWPLATPGALLYDVGGGRNPFVPPPERVRLRLRVRAVDVDAAELSAAPAGAYDETLCADLCALQASSDGDLAVCRTVLEHVNDPHGALRGLASLLKPGAHAAVLLPCRTATFARLNRLMPQRWKRALLNFLRPETQGLQGFPAYYLLCTPSQMRDAAILAGLEVVKVRAYFVSNYFYFFFPIHALWRAWAEIHRALRGDEAAEYFALLLRKSLPDHPPFEAKGQ